MSKRELARVEVLSRVRSEELRVVDAGRLMQVSYRQAKRLWKRYREEGATGLQHRSAGRSSNHGHAKKFRQKVLGLVREKYGGAVGERFGPTLAAEHLAAEDGLQVDAETLRRWMLAEGLWSRERRRRRHRRRRDRKEHWGEMVQMDGSFHAWLEDRGPEGCLIDMVDDATNKTWAQLGEQETIWAVADALRAWIERYGVPQMVVSPDGKWLAYTDYPRGYLWRCKVEGGEKLQLTDSLAQMPTWSPDSKWIAYSDWRELHRVSVDGGAPEKLTSEGFTEVLPSWSPDGKSIYFNDYPIQGHLRIRVLDLDTRKVTTMPGSDGYYAPSWSPDGQYLAAIQNPPKSAALYSVNTKQWKQLKVFEHDWGFFVWARDSKSIFYIRGPSEVGVGEQTGIGRLTVPDGKWELYAKFTGMNPDLQGAQDFLSVTPEGDVAAMSDTSVTQIYQMQWKNAE